MQKEDCMKKRLLALLLTLSITTISLTGCGSKIQATNLMEEKKPANPVKMTSISETNTITATDFAVRLFQQAKNGEENTLISPLSVLPALSMTCNGAKDETRFQMEQTLGMPVDKLNDYLYSYIHHLPNEKDCQFHLANSIWLRDAKDFIVDDNFLKNNAKYYDAGIYQSAFDDQTLADINNWVAAQTNDMIPTILDQIDSDAYMYLINALSFDSKWSSIYESSSVSNDVFTTENGTSQDVEMMHSSEYEYIEDENVSGFLKPYSGYSYAFVALLPKEGIPLTEYVNSLTGEHLHHLLTTVEECPITAGIPKFETEFSIDLIPPLQTLGIHDAFDKDLANFSGMGSFDSPWERLYINSILHKSFFSIGEKGTKAGASTIVGMEKSASSINPEEAKEVILDRPFLYMIVDYENRFPIFIGTADDMQ